MPNWNAEHYLKYGDERTRPAADLAARIRIDRPAVIADLGCGPGNSTQILRDRWPQSEIIGIDNSPQMIEAAKRAYPDQNWLLADVSQWKSSGPVDLLYSNAALQWLPDHGVLMPRLFGMAAAGGALAFQIPSAPATDDFLRHNTLALSCDGKMLATSNQDHAVQLWNLPAHKLIAVLKGHERAIASIAFSADGTRVATSSYDGSIRLWTPIRGDR